MKFILLISLTFIATLYVASAQHLPEVLIERAREMIHVAEQELHKHRQSGSSHLTRALEYEIDQVRILERELLALEQHRHMDVSHVNEIEERLLHHENRLMEAIVEIMHRRAKEREEEENRKIDELIKE